jgi:hypothetical protein
MKASTTIPKGALIGIEAASGLAINAVAGASITAPVAGVAAQTKTSGSSGSTSIEAEFDADFLFAASSITQVAVGTEMLVVDNNTIDETSASSASVGKLVEFVSATLGWVFIKGLTT